MDFATVVNFMRRISSCSQPRLYGIPIEIALIILVAPVQAISLVCPASVRGFYVVKFYSRFLALLQMCLRNDDPRPEHRLFSRVSLLFFSS